MNTHLIDVTWLFFSGTRRHLLELDRTEVMVTSLGRARLRATVRLCSSCHSESSLFPFDRIHCSTQLVPDSPATRLTQPPPNNNLIPPIDSRVKSWTSCRYLWRPVSLLTIAVGVMGLLRRKQDGNRINRT